jgi:hypothetical protein
MTVDEGLVRALLQHLEVCAHRDGWDRPPALYALYDVAAHPETGAAWRRHGPREAGAPVRRGSLTAHPMVGGTMWSRARPPNEALRAMAVKITRGVVAGPNDPLARVIGQPGLVGIAMRSEAWMMVETVDAAATRLKAGRSLADTPGASEARSVWAFDLADRGYDVLRRRGQAPRVRVFPADEAAGFVADSLRAILGAAAGQPRPDLLDPARLDPDSMAGR